MNKNLEKRKQNRLEQLGSNNPVCIICGETDWRCLEQHHIAGRKNSDDLCTLCRNCHRKLSDSQKDQPKQYNNNPPQNESIGYTLLGLADFFELLIERLREYGNSLIQQCKGKQENV